MGFSGVQNFPTIGLFDGTMRTSFEETGMGYGLEVDMIAAAHALDLLTTPYVFNPDEAARHDPRRRRHHRRPHGRHHRRRDRRHLGQDRSTTASPRSTPSPTPPAPTRADVIVLCHGGPIAEPDDAAYILQARRAPATASTAPPRMERLPVERALTEQTRAFKAIGKA